MSSPLAEIDYDAWLTGSLESAEATVPLILAATDAQSVVDVGCGLGAWLAIFKRHGIEQVLGYDGPWVDRSRLLIAPSEFRAADFDEPLVPDRRFDLAICLETAHMLERGHAAAFVGSLVALAPIVVFSAGIPGQPGINHHNEQWPQYWAELFGEHGYVACDPFRAELWEHAEVKWWFAQNMLCFGSEPELALRPTLERSRCETAPLPLVHPGLLTQILEEFGEKRVRRSARWPKRFAMK